MKRVLFLLLLAGAAEAQVNVARVAEDALVIDRVAEASKRDLPTDLLERIIAEDIDALRGKRADGTYEHATYERFEAGRTTQSFSIQPRSDKMQTVEMRGAFIYRVIVDVPQRRLVVRRNRPVWVERVDIEYVSQDNSQTRRESTDIKAWLQPGEVRPIDLPVVARQATVRVVATADAEGGYGNLDVALVHARIVDNPDSPYADAVGAAKAVQRALENNDIPSIRAMAKRMGEALGAPRAARAIAPGSSTIDVTAAPDVAMDRATQLELQTELQLIEDLLTGSESERRE
ncbi:MAG TPA: hypothetical protein VHL59_19110, partial [Thermoanaerobaculia bacterium]|nr:hypothetical protein [Thermoanaerobaculia bacterium]